MNKGTRVRGLLEYLWGPGKSDEHVNPRIVAGYDDPAVLAPPRHPEDRQRWSLAELAAKLDAPQEALGERGLREYVLQVSLSVRSDERAISDEEWARIAHRYIDKMGFGGDGKRAGCRWIAVHHGKSINKNDHIHLVITRATEDGAPVYLRGEWPASQRACDEIEDEFGLRKDTPARSGATVRPNVSRAEVEQARRAGRDVADREVLRREVRAALAGARDEADWIGRMKAAGLLVAARADADDPMLTVGYAVALPPGRGAGKPRWSAGRMLDGELSLHRVRQRWPDGARLSPAEWRAVSAREPVVLSDGQRIEVWRSTAAALEDVTRRLAAVAPGSPEWPAVARSSADVLAVTAMVAEPSGSGPVSRAADILARAAASKRRDSPASDSATARELGRIADAIVLAGGARGSSEVAVVVALVVAAARLIVAIAELRAAQRDAHAAGAAQLAALRLMPILTQAQQVTAVPVVDGVVSPQRGGARPPAARPEPDRPGQDRDQQR